MMHPAAIEPVASATLLDHATFVEAWQSGAIEVAIDPIRAARLMSSRMLLPFVAVAVIGLGIGLVIWGWLWTGITVGACGIIAPRLIKRSAAGFLLQHVAEDAELYRAAIACGAVGYRTTGSTAR